MPNLLLDRYLNGECQEVWQDMVALGAAVRSDFYYKDVQEVATETMKRARHNVESIVGKLDTLGYRFSPQDDENPIFSDPFEAAEQAMLRAFQTLGPIRTLPGMPNLDPAEIVKQTVARMAQAREPGFEPRNAQEEMMAQAAKGLEMVREQMAQRAPQIAKLRAATEEARQKFENVPSLQNPRVFQPPTKKTPKELENFENEMDGPLPISVRSWYEHVGGVNLAGVHPVLTPDGDCYSRGPLIVFSFGQSQEFMQFMADEDDPQHQDLEFYLWAEDGDQFWVKVPDPRADAGIMGLQERTFVEHLRATFAWGGFPGWRHGNQPPPKELDYLREGLLPL
jgi:hypothetical protein